MITIEEMYVVVMSALEQSILITTGVCYILGILLILNAIYSTSPNLFDQSDDKRNEANKLISICIKLAVGAALLYFPTTIHTLNETIQTQDLLGYSNPVDHDQDYKAAKGIAYLYIQLIGILAVIRGFVIFTHKPNKEVKRNIAKAINLILGGALCLNLHFLIDLFVKGMNNLTGIDKNQLWSTTICATMCFLSIAVLFQVINAAGGRNSDNKKESEKASRAQQASHQNTEH